MDIYKNNKEWITASNHQAFVDIVCTIREEMLKSFDREIVKVVGFDNSLRDGDSQTHLENQLNDVIATELFTVLNYDQFISLINSHKTDK
jgi:hypothetical protein